ncbi:MAG: ATP-binding cassette domain-containing protein [Betaproteobacteria bacterium]|nr:ATP-binding cassette domain-containing protein [Betaproteobacteria bacterium]
MILLSGVTITRRGGARSVRLAFPDLDLPQGGLLALRGASGSGKSTLIALIAGLLVPDEGQLGVCGTHPARLPPAQRDAWRGRTLGLLPQRLHLLPALSVRENLLLAGLAVGAPASASRERADALLARFQLAALAGARPAELSGGQAQRVALARALMNRPQLLIADEPTASLDDDSAALAIGQLLLAWRDTGASLLVSTHDARALAMLRDAPGECRVLDLGRAAGAS